MTTAAKKATGRCCNTPIVNQEIRLLKAMSSPRLDTAETANFQETSCDTPTGQPVPADGAVSVSSVSDSHSVTVADTHNNDSPNADSHSVRDTNDLVTISISEQTTGEKKPSTLSKRAARRVRLAMDRRAIMCDTRG